MPEGPLAENVCFPFAGSFAAFREPVSEGFALSVDEGEPLRFDLARSDSQWPNTEETVVLSFRRRWSTDDDAAGFFYVSVLPELVTPGKPCRIGVRTLGSDSERWFGVNPVGDSVDLEATNVILDPSLPSRMRDEG